MTRTGPKCAVDDCGTTGTRDLPLGDGTSLDLRVCAYHQGVIGREPERWRIVALPIIGGRERTVVQRVDDPEPET